MKRGWYRESVRHGLAARGISTSRYFVSRAKRRRAKALGVPVLALPLGPERVAPVLRTGQAFTESFEDERARLQLIKVGERNPEKRQQFEDNLERIEQIKAERESVREANADLRVELDPLIVERKEKNARLSGLREMFKVGGDIDDVPGKLAEFQQLEGEVLSLKQKINTVRGGLVEFPVERKEELKRLTSEQKDLLKLTLDEREELEENLMRSLGKVQRAQAAVKGPETLETEAPILVGEVTTGLIGAPHEEGRQPRVLPAGPLVDELRAKRRRAGGPGVRKKSPEQVAEKLDVARLTDAEKARRALLKRIQEGSDGDQ